MKRHRLLIAVGLAIFASPIAAQILPSGAQRVQGADDPAVNRGYPVRTFMVDETGTGITAVNGKIGVIIYDGLGVPVDYTTPSAVSQSGTWNITNVSGTVSLPTGAATSAKQDTISGQLPASLGIKTAAASLSIAPASDASFTVGLPTGAATAANQTTANSSLSTLAGAVTSAKVQVDCITGCTATSSAVAQGSTTSGQNGILTQGAVTTAAPAYTTAQTSPLSLTTGGALRVDASATTVVVGGSVADNGVAAGNPVMAGCLYESTLSTYAAGDVGDCHLGSRGSLHVELFGANTTQGAATLASNADAESNSYASLNVSSHLANFNGTTWDRVRGDTSGLVNQPFAMAGSRWSYAAAASGISNTTTAVTVAAAAGASVRNYVTSMQCDSGALGAATELAVRDGAGGTVLWRGFVTTAGWTGGRQITFYSPLRGTANTLVEIVTLTASITGAVYCNLQGYTGS